MSATVSSVPVKTSNDSVTWSLWLRQIGAILRLELEKNFLGRRSFLIYLITFLPLLPLLVTAVITPPGNEWRDLKLYGTIYAFAYNGVILRTVVFFGCAWIFMN